LEGAAASDDPVAVPSTADGACLKVGSPVEAIQAMS
jgi:hypothetical protein